MASKKKASVVSAVVTLAVIVKATQENGFTFINPADAVQFVEAGFAEVNPSEPNEKGEIPIRATQKGIEEMSKSTASTPASKPETKAAFALETGVPVPAISGRGGRVGSSVYPFESMEVGQSFFVPNAEGKPEAVKALASTVSSANRRYAVPAADGATKKNKAGEEVPVMVKTRVFIVRSVKEGGKEGARVWRTA